MRLGVVDDLKHVVLTVAGRRVFPEVRSFSLPNVVLHHTV